MMRRESCLKTGSRRAIVGGVFALGFVRKIIFLPGRMCHRFFPRF